MVRGVLILVPILGSCGGVDAPVGDLILTSSYDIVGYHYVRDHRPTAVGGSQTFELHYRADGAFPRPGDLFERSFSVRVDKHIFHVKTDGPFVTLTAVGEGTSTFEILGDNGGEYFTTALSAYAATGIAIEPKYDLGIEPSVPVGQPPPISFAWWKAPYMLGVFVSAAPESVGLSKMAALVDENMEIQLPNATIGGEGVTVDPPMAGSYPLSVAVGGETFTETFVVVETIDSLALAKSAPAFAIPNGSTELCYESRTGGRYVYGAPITYAFRGMPVTHTEIHQPCVYFMTDATTGSVTVDATVGGITLSTTIPVGL